VGFIVERDDERLIRLAQLARLLLPQAELVAELRVVGLAACSG